MKKKFSFIDNTEVIVIGLKFRLKAYLLLENNIKKSRLEPATDRRTRNYEIFLRKLVI